MEEISNSCGQNSYTMKQKVPSAKECTADVLWGFLGGRLMGQLKKSELSPSRQKRRKEIKAGAVQAQVAL